MLKWRRMKENIAKTCTISSPCKINLHLNILDKRVDGYHNLESIFAALDFGDNLRLERLSSKNADCHFFTSGLKIDTPKEQNLVYKALELFRKKTGIMDDLEIKLEKKVPTGAGLGGGSSNAASTLIALNALFSVGLKRNDLLELSLELGSDVPFFLEGGTALAGGRGEILETLHTPKEKWVLLVLPPFSCSTKEAFFLLDDHRKNNNSIKTEKKLPKKEELNKILKENAVNWRFFNDFLEIYKNSSYGNEYKTYLDTLNRSGASFSSLSGSGSTCFGIFDNQEKAQKAANLFTECSTRVTFFLAQNAKAVLEW